MRTTYRKSLPLALGAAALAAVTVAQAQRSEVRIPLRPEMIVNETALGDPALLVDEQASVGDPAAKEGTRPLHPYFGGWTAWQYPMHVVVDLGAARHLTRLFLYNESGENPIVLSTGKPFAWRDRPATLGGYQEWREFPLDTTTRYLRLTVNRPTNIPEMALYGEGPAPSATPPVPHQRRVEPPTMDQFIGTNAFIDDPLDKLAASVGFVREYHNWRWDTEGPDHQVRFQPSGAAGGKFWFFDDFYARLKTLGVTVCPALQQSSPVDFPGADLDAKPVQPGKSPEDPASYALHARHLYQYAARYGGTPAPDAQLQIAADQPRRSGLGSLRYLENWNEPDKTWRGKEGRFSPYELAAMCSADYDGDQGRMGKDVGVRNADRRMRLVMGGLAGISVDYLRAMKLWADFHRSGDFPADVINLHHYSSDGNEQGFKTTGISPEADHLREKFAALTAWRDANLPDRELWVTEFGYDTNQKSPLHAPPVGSYTAEETQAIWLVRSYLALAAAGVDRAAMFMFRDVNPADGGVFATCGMVTEKGQWKPKPSYYYIATLRKRLAGMRFAGEVPTGKQNVLAYHFTGTGTKAAYVVWCPSSQDARVADVTLPLTGKTATRVEFTNSLEGAASPLQVREGKVTLEAREKPVLVLTP